MNEKLTTKQQDILRSLDKTSICLVGFNRDAERLVELGLATLDPHSDRLEITPAGKLVASELNPF